jgi:aerobic carbon-monoxide dehydrogenase medium subunit
MKKYDYYQPRTVNEALHLMDDLGDGARYIAGGTDLIVRIKQKVMQPDALISLQGIDSLKGFQVNEQASIGSMTLFRDIERSKELRKSCPALVEAVTVLANPQVRNVGTPGGNISNAAPSADCAPPLLVMEAVLTVEGPGGERRIPIEDFFIGPGKTCMDSTEILTRILVPGIRKGTGTVFLKVGRVSQDIAIANAAALLVMEGQKCRKCRIAAGAVAPVPLRLKKVEKLLEDRIVDKELMDEAARLASKEVQPITDVRSTEEYRRHISGVLVKKAIQQAMEQVQ